MSSLKQFLREYKFGYHQWSLLGAETIAEIYNSMRLFNKIDFDDVMNVLEDKEIRKGVDKEQVILIAKLVCAASKEICPYVEKM